MTSLVNGAYTGQTDQATVDWMIKKGIPKAMVEQTLGYNWWFSLEIIEGGEWVVNMKCEENSAFNSVDKCKMGVVNEMDTPIFGGKAKVLFNSIGDNKFYVKCDSETLGHMEWEEHYRPDGIEMTYKDAKAGNHVLFYERQFKETGWFKFVKGENLKNFLKAQGTPPEMCSDEAEDAMLHFENSGDKQTMTEIWAGSSNKFSFKLDEEFDYSWPGMPNMDRKIVMIKAGPGKYKMVMKGKNGEREDWELQFCDKGCLYSGVDHKSGQSCKLWYESFTNIFGEFRPIVTCGFEPYAIACGMPADIASKLPNEIGAKMTMTKKENGYINVKLESKFIPMDLTFRLNEEFEYSIPGMPFKQKAIETLHGDTLLYVGKNPKITVKSVIKFTDNFLIQTGTIVGTNISFKMIMERI